MSNNSRDEENKKLNPVRIGLGTVYAHGGDLGSAIHEITGDSIENISIPGLAGPNEIIQILADIGGWHAIAKGLLTGVGTYAGQQISKAAWEALKPKLDQAQIGISHAIKSFLTSIRSSNAAGNDVSMGLIEPTFDYHMRADRISLVDLSDTEILGRILVFSNCVDLLEPWLIAEKASADADGRRPSLTMHITPEGNLIASLATGRPNGQLIEKIFSFNGELLEEHITNH